MSIPLGDGGRTTRRGFGFGRGRKLCQQCLRLAGTIRGRHATANVTRSHREPCAGISAGSNRETRPERPDFPRAGFARFLSRVNITSSDDLAGSRATSYNPRSADGEPTRVDKRTGCSDRRRGGKPPGRLDAEGWADHNGRRGLGRAVVPIVRSRWPPIRPRPGTALVPTRADGRGRCRSTRLPHSDVVA